MWRALVFLALFVAIVERTHAQQEPLFDLLTTADGLPDPMVNTLFEDHEGFIWVGTGAGLARLEGTRIFPKDQSMTVDDIGTRDVMAILVYNQPIDFPTVDKQMKANPATGLDGKLAAVLSDELIDPTNVNYTAVDGSFGASCDASRNAVALVIEVEKR
jgi:hypothetical protein